eukprot:767040-Hanusia_phi.AAC.2
MPDNSGGEVSSEGLHTCVSAISLYSDVIESSRGNALTRSKMLRRSGFVASSKSEILLEFLRRFELISEMLCDRAVGGQKFIFLLGIELAKACCKIQNCRKGRDVDHRTKRLGLTRAHRFQLSWSHVDTLRFRWWLAGSTIHALRPILYLALMQKLGSKSWIPWVVSFFIDVLSEALSTHPKFVSKHTGKNASQQQSSQTCSVAGDSYEVKGVDVENPAHGGDELRTTSSQASILNHQTFVEQQERTKGTSKESKNLLRRQMRAEAIELILQKEIQRRRGLLLLYLFRPPVFQILLVPLVFPQSLTLLRSFDEVLQIKLLHRATSRIPIAGSLLGNDGSLYGCLDCAAGVLLDMLMSLGRYYFYTSGT